MIFDGDKSRIGPYLRELADLMGLRDWTITFNEDAPAEEDAGGRVEIVYGRKYASIQIHAAWTTDTPETLRYYCVHELVHAHLEPMRWALNSVQTLLGSMAFEVLEGAHTDALEVAIDGIAREWATHLPLPILADEEGADAA